MDGFRLPVCMVAVWGLVLLPALCVGGVLEHPCDCADGVSCEHEADCHADPCEVVSIRPSDLQGRDTVPDFNGFAFVAPVPVVCHAAVADSPSACLSPPRSSPYAGSPLAVATTVLLI